MPKPRADATSPKTRHSAGNAWNRVILHTCERMVEIPDHAVHLAVVAPPFTNDKDRRTLDKEHYIAFLQRVFVELDRVTHPLGTLVTINTDLRDHARYNRGQREYDGLLWHKHSDICRIAAVAGFACFHTKIWAKSLKTGVYRLTYSHVQLFRRPNLAQRLAARPPVPGFAPDVWLLPGGSHRRLRGGGFFRDAIHPLIAARCIAQFTRPGDLVLAPFAGSGTIPAVAHIMDRTWMAYETDKSLLPLIRQSVYGPVRPPVFATSALDIALLAHHSSHARS